ncbi:MAG: hypothetical protein ACXAC6_11415 [Candidatus Hodarchaeales archaeon]|jgi:hypothetical protein
MWESLILFGIVAIVLYFVIYSYYSQNIKEEKDFAKDVFYYLIRRYPDTEVTDWGGLSSDPIVESRNAGPFRTLEVRVTTEKRNGVIDRDLILRGMVDVKKYQIARNDVSNVLISPRIAWNDPKTKVTLGLQALDKRLNVNAYNPVFVRDLIVRTDLGVLIGKNYDFEAFSLHWYKTGDLAIQIRMESMNSSSFLSAFNMALASVGILIQKGYLTRHSKQQEKIITKGKSPKMEDYSAIRKIPTYKASELPKINVDKARHQEKLEIKQKLKSYSVKSINGEIEKPSIILPDNDLTEVSPFKPLFTSIRYQVKYINYEKNRVIIGTFSTQVTQIVVTFPNSDETKIVGKSIQKPRESFNIRINNSQEPQAPTWDNPWKNIELTGNSSMIEQIKFRTAIANRINEISFINIDITGSDDGISYSIIVRKSKPAITAGYSLFIDLVWFFEML